MKIKMLLILLLVLISNNCYSFIVTPHANHSINSYELEEEKGIERIIVPAPIKREVICNHNTITVFIPSDAPKSYSDEEICEILKHKEQRISEIIKNSDNSFKRTVLSVYIICVIILVIFIKNVYNR